MDAFLVKRIAAELAAELPGALVSKILQPGEREIVLVLWTGHGEKRLLLSAHPELCRIHLTTRRAPNPPVPPPFCQFLRRHLEGMRVGAVDSVPWDRLVRIDFGSSRPDALHARTTLHAELYGRHANLIYADGDGTILAALRTVAPEESRIREVAPGIPYRPLPRPERVLLPDVTADDAERIFAAGGAALPRAILAEVSGLGRELAREAAERGKESPAALLAALREFARRYAEDDDAPGIGVLPGGKRRLLPFPCGAGGFVGFEAFPSANDAADRYYADVAAAAETAALRQKVASRIATLLRRERHTLENVEGDEARLLEGLEGGARGELLKAHLPDLRKGMAEFRGVLLDPARTPVENMERYFRLHKKAKRAAQIVRDRKRDVTETVYYLETLEQQLAAAGSFEDLVALRQELSAAFPPKERRGTKKDRREAAKVPEPQVERVEFRGFTILVGRNNVGNDRIVKELAAPDDLWLHARGIPGSHVLVKRPTGKEVPAAVVEEAARLAVLHSKAKGSANVPVFLAEARHVSKFRGAKPGLVRITKHRTLNVR